MDEKIAKTLKKINKLAKENLSAYDCAELSLVLSTFAVILNKLSYFKEEQIKGNNELAEARLTQIEELYQELPENIR